MKQLQSFQADKIQLYLVLIFQLCLFLVPPPLTFSKIWMRNRTAMALVKAEVIHLNGGTTF